MSDMMDDAVIGMPFDLAMQNELSRRQFYSRAMALLNDRYELRAEVNTLRRSLRIARDALSEDRRDRLVAEINVVLGEGS